MYVASSEQGDPVWCRSAGMNNLRNVHGAQCILQVRLALPIRESKSQGLRWVEAEHRIDAETKTSQLKSQMSRRYEAKAASLDQVSLRNKMD
jgi:hypothetical protein